MNKKEDDVKVFIPKPKTGNQADASFDEMKKDYLNGNLSKAKNLGRIVAGTFAKDAENNELLKLSVSCGVDLTRKIKDEAIILCVFTAEYAFDRTMTKTLSAAAVSNFYDVLTEDSAELYNKLLSSGSYSFYYMDIDENENGSLADPEKIGGTFAMLCSEKGNENFIKYGSEIFSLSYKKYRNMIDNTEFKK